MKKRKSLKKRALQLAGLYLLKKRMDKKETERAKKLAQQEEKKTSTGRKLLAKIPVPEALLYSVLIGVLMKGNKTGKKNGIIRQDKSAVKNAKTAGARHTKSAAVSASGRKSAKKKIAKSVAKAVVRRVIKK